MKFGQVLQYLLDTESSLNPSVLYNLSQIQPEEMERLIALWSAIPVARRRSLMRELLDIAEMNFEVDFEQIFRWGLHDTDHEVRAISIEGLWENEELSLMTELLHLLQNDASALVRAAAATSLGRFILLCELGKLPDQVCRPVYDALQNIVLQGAEDLEVHRRALESIAYASDEAVMALISEAYEHPEEQMRVSAIFGMGRSADARWIEIVMQELFSSSPEMRYEAARACGELEARAAVSRLADLIDDPDREVQEVALWALGQIGGDEARQLLELCCEEGDPAVRHMAEEALETLELMYSHLDLPFYEIDKIDGTDADLFS